MVYELAIAEIHPLKNLKMTARWYKKQLTEDELDDLPYNPVMSAEEGILGIYHLPTIWSMAHRHPLRPHLYHLHWIHYDVPSLAQGRQYHPTFMGIKSYKNLDRQR